jgi:hypothetical protein
VLWNIGWNAGRRDSLDAPPAHSLLLEYMHFAKGRCSLGHCLALHPVERGPLWVSVEGLGIIEIDV